MARPANYDKWTDRMLIDKIKRLEIQLEHTTKELKESRLTAVNYAGALEFFSEYELDKAEHYQRISMLALNGDDWLEVAMRLAKA